MLRTTAALISAFLKRPIEEGGYPLDSPDPNPFRDIFVHYGLNHHQDELLRYQSTCGIRVLKSR
jgi:hypothetical protein